MSNVSNLFISSFFRNKFNLDIKICNLDIDMSKMSHLKLPKQKSRNLCTSNKVFQIIFSSSYFRNCIYF